MNKVTKYSYIEDMKFNTDVLKMHTGVNFVAQRK